jgi:hypothetical protein
MTTPAARIEEVTALKKFITAGHALFTVVSKKTGIRRTFKVRVLPAKPGRKDILWGVSYLSGPENTSDYQYLGTLYPRGDKLGFKVKESISPTSESAVAFGWLVKALNGESDLAQCEIWHAGKCGRCGRVLTDPESIATGLGPKCAGR